MGFVQLLNLIAKNRVKLQTAFRSVLCRKPLHDLILEARMKANFNYFDSVKEKLERDAAIRIYRCWRNYRYTKEKKNLNRRSKAGSRASNLRGLRGGLNRKDSNASVASIASRNNSRTTSFNKTMTNKKSPVTGVKK